MPILPDAGVFSSDDIVALDTATLDVIANTRLIEENLPTTMEVHTREGHPFQWLHGPHKDPYKVTEYGEKLGLARAIINWWMCFPWNIRNAPHAVYCGRLIVRIRYRS